MRIETSQFENMKFTLIAVIALAAVAQGFVLPVQDEIVFAQGNVIDNLVREALEFIRGLLKKNEPYTLPDVPQQNIVDSDVNLNVKISNAKISKSDDFVVEKVENNLPNLWAKFDLKAPQPHMEGDFAVNGQAYGKTVSGQGSFAVDLKDMDQSGMIQMGLKNHGLYIKDLTLNYTLGDAKFSISGLNVQGMTEAQILDFLNNNLIDTLNKNKPEVCKKVAQQIMEKGNALIAGKSLKELIEWLKNFIGH